MPLTLQCWAGGGVDGAIHRAAGPELLEECKKVPVVNGVRCPTGEARATGAGRLPSRFVFHAVGPRYFADNEPKKLLKSAYTACLDLAIEKRCQSIAFPAISCGVYGYPLEEAAEIAISVCRASKYDSLGITFYLFSDDVMHAWQQALT